jgi:hypothetical protein
MSVRCPGAGLGMASMGLALDAAVPAADDPIGKGEALSVWLRLHPELERALTAESPGDAALPPVAAIHAEGAPPRGWGNTSLSDLAPACGSPPR